METVAEAEDYDSMDHSAVNHQFVDDFIACAAEHFECRSGNGSFIVDLGTGTAQIPILFSRRLKHRPAVIACDRSEEMLRVARWNVARAGCGATVIPALCDARQLPLGDHSCNRVISNSLIHHILHPPEVFREVRRIAAPEALVFFRDLLRPGSAEEVESLVQKWAGDATQHQQKMFRDSLHAALTMDELCDILSSVALDTCRVRQTSDRHWTVAGRL